MAQVILAAVGGVAGFMVGGPMGALKGASLGYSIGGMFTSSPDNPDITNRSSQLTDLRVAGTEYGQCIPFLKASAQMAGQIVWNTDKRPTTTRTQATQSGGGKGGAAGGGSQTTINEVTTYDMDMLLLFTDNIIAGIPRVWVNGKLAWEFFTGFADVEPLWDQMTVYTGDPAQLPDPIYEAAVGSANAIAYRHRGTALLKSLKLGQSGSIPSLLFEVAESAAIEKLATVELYTLPGGEKWPNDLGNSQVTYFTRNVPGAEYFWAVLEDGTGAGRRLGLFNNVTHELIFSKAYTRGMVSLVGVGLNGRIWIEEHGVGNTTSALRCIEMNGEESTVVDPALAFNSSENRMVMLYEVGNEYMYLQFNPTAAGRQEILRTIDHATTWTDTSVAVLGCPALSTVEKVQDHLEFADNADRIPGRLYICGAWSGTAPFATTNGTIGWIDPATDLYTLVREYNREQLPKVLVGKDGFLYARSRNTNAANVFEKMDQDGNVVDSVVLTGLAVNDYLANAPIETAVQDANGNIVLQVGAKIWRIVCGTMSLDASNTFANNNYTLLSGDAFQGWGVMLSCVETGASPNNVLRVLKDIFTGGTRTVQHVSDALLTRAAMPVSLYDVAPLASITKPVRSFAVSQVGPTRAPFDILTSCFFFEMTVSDKIYCRPRGGAAVDTIAFDRLGAIAGGAGSDSEEEPLTLHLNVDLELPAQIAFTYANVSKDYELDTQLSDRLVSATPNTVSAIQLAIGMTPAEAKAVADVISLDGATSLITTKLSLLGDAAKLEPTDPVIVTDKDGNTFRVRLVRFTDAFPVLEYEAVLDDVSILTSQGITSADYTSSTLVNGLGQTLARLLDIPILQDADNNAGFYWAGRWAGTARGSLLNSSVDNVTYEAKSLITSPATMGFTETALGDWTDSRMFDEVNKVRVNLGTSGVMTSSTRELMLATQSLNALLIGNELMQVRDATLVSDGVYDLTGFIRGGRGTEWAQTGHVAGERVVLLAAGGVGRVPMANSDIGSGRYYKGVTVGKSLASAMSQPFTNNAVGLKPFSPVYIRVSKDPVTGTFTITGQRRSRLAVRLGGSLGVSVPLGEDSELYQINVYNADGSTLVRSYLSTSSSFQYTVAQQTADFGGETFATQFSMQQMSGQVGAGYESEKRSFNFGAYRYWRFFNMTCVGGGGSMRNSEIQLFQGATNVAAGGVGTVSPGFMRCTHNVGLSAGGVAALFDGLLATGNNVSQAILEDPASYIQFDFGNCVNTEVRLTAMNLGMPGVEWEIFTGMTVQYSPDATNWTTKKVISGLTFAGANILYPSNISLE